MRISYIILVHKDPKQLHRLIHKLYDSKASFVIHLDKKQDINEFKQELSEFDHIYFTDQEDCRWGGLSLIDATLNAMKATMSIDYDYAVLLSGQDYPIKSKQYINDFFEYSNGALYMETFSPTTGSKEWQKALFDERLNKYYYSPADNNSWYRYDGISSYEVCKDPRQQKWEKISGNDEIKKRFIDCNGERTKPEYINEWWGGSQWWALPKKAVDEILSFVKNHKDYYEFHKHTFIPDEIFFQTIVMNDDELKGLVINSRLRFIDFSNPEEQPVTFGDDYIIEFKRFCTSDYPLFLFARKFDSIKSNNLMKAIDDETDKTMSKNAICHIKPQVFNFNTIGDLDDCKVVKAAELVFNPFRFDLIIKYIYAKSRIDGVKTDWFNALYIEQRRYLNNFHEDNYLDCHSGDEFLNIFNNVIDSFINNGCLEPVYIPTHSDLVPLDGAHRIAILAAINQEVIIVPFIKKSKRTNYTYDYRFFREKGMPASFMDYAALEYVRLANNVYSICLFPSCQKYWGQIDKMIRDTLSVYYDKEAYFNDTGKLNFIKTLYRTESWLGTYANGFKGARWKMEQCFSKDGGIKVYIVNSDSLEKVIALKKRIRDLCGIENHSVHSTDVYSTTFELASMVLHEPTIAFLNTASQNDFTNFHYYFSQYRSFIENSQCDRNNFCIDGSAILASCCLRDCRDLDFLTTEEEHLLTGLPEGVDCHNDYIMANEFDRLLGLSIYDIVYDPRNYFYYEGLKIMEPELIKKIKDNRKEPKDLKDSALLDRYLKERARFYDKSLSDIPDDAWYPEFDSIIVSIGKEHICGLLNTKFIYSDRIKKIMKMWELSYPDLPKTQIELYNYYFEVFKELDLSHEDAFWEDANDLLPEYSLENEDLYGDTLSILRLCYTSYISQFSPNDFRNTFIRFCKEASAAADNDIISLIINKIQ